MLSYRLHLVEKARNNPKLSDVEKRQICEYAASSPRIVRREGGEFLKGFRIGEQVPGNSEAFDTRGNLKPKYHHLRIRINELKGAPSNQTTLRPRRGCNRSVLLPQPFVNRFKPLESTIFTKITSNLYCETNFNGKRPRYWPKGWDWPQDPTYIPSDQQHCELCNDLVCRCIDKILKAQNHPLVVDDGERGQGLQAVVGKRAAKNTLFDKNGRARAHKADDILGELTGILLCHLKLIALVWKWR